MASEILAEGKSKKGTKEKPVLIEKKTLKTKVEEIKLGNARLIQKKEDS